MNRIHKSLLLFVFGIIFSISSLGYMIVNQNMSASFYNIINLYNGEKFPNNYRSYKPIKKDNPYWSEQFYIQVNENNQLEFIYPNPDQVLLNSKVIFSESQIQEMIRLDKIEIPIYTHKYGTLVYKFTIKSAPKDTSRKMLYVFFGTQDKKIYGITTQTDQSIDTLLNILTHQNTHNSSTISDFDTSEFLNIVNQIRKNGSFCGETYYPSVHMLEWNNKLSEASLAQSQYMLTNNHFSHTQLNGSTAGDRIQATGYSWRAYGENLAYNYFTTQSVIDAWMESPGHCKNIMNPSVTQMGSAKIENYWTQVFATPL